MVVRYPGLMKLGILAVRSMKFKCSVDHPKRSFFRAANSIFAKVGRLASEEVILELLIRKYLPVLLYGLEVHVLIKRALRSLDFSFNRFYVIVLKLLMRKLFRHAKKCFTVNYQAFS